MLLQFVATKFHIDRDFLYILAAAFCFEAMSLTMYHKSVAFRDRTLFCKWPCFFLFAVLLILATSGKTGVASIPLAMLCWMLAISSTWFYERYKGINKGTTFWKKFIGSCGLVIATMNINLLPPFAVLIPVKYLSAKYPYWNVAVSGFGLPAFIVVL